LSDVRIEGEDIAWNGEDCRVAVALVNFSIVLVTHEETLELIEADEVLASPSLPAEF
jgi:hypothetical protein